MKLRFVFAFAVIAGVGGILAGCSESGTSTTAAALSRQDLSRYNYTGEVYLLRGLANVFSTGLDDINARFQRRGVNSKVDNHAVWQVWADDIVARNQRGQVSYPIIIMGHSLGGNACVQMARYLGDRGIKVSYVAAFDPTITTEPGPNVDEVVNYYLPNGKKGKDLNIVVEGPGFTGTLANVDMTPAAEINHFNIEKNPELQVRVMTKTMALLKPRFQGSEPGDNR
jgi:hypothetical protein